MRDMTQGSPYSHLWRYALPLLLANWLQLAYNAVDSIIAGRFIGREALAAEGIAAPIMNLVILAISGVCIGAGVLMSERYGARDLKGLHKTLSTTLVSGMTTSIAVALAGFALSPLILKLLLVPDEIMPVTIKYLRITFLGAPFTFAYNALAAAMKSVGDSKTPLKFLAFSAILNAVLDLILLGVFHMGIITSATTTVIAEAASAMLAMHYLITETPQLLPERGEWSPDRRNFFQLMKYGAPSAIQQAMQPIGKVMIQGYVNALGVNAIAAYNAVTRVDGFALIPEQGIASAISTYIAQNRGANKEDRIKSGFAAGIRMELIYGVFIALLAFTLRRPIVAMFVKGDGTNEVIELGAAYLSIMSFLYILPGLTNGFQGYFRGIGRIPVTILCTGIQITLRVISTALLSPVMSIRGIAIACGIGWMAMLAFEIPYALHDLRQRTITKS